MMVKDLVKACEELASHPSTLHKVNILKGYAENPLLIQLLAGEIPITGVAEQIVLDAIQDLLKNHFTKEELESKVAETGDYGIVAKSVRETLSGYSPDVTLDSLKEAIAELCTLSGKIEKMERLSELFVDLTPDGCCVITNLLLGKMKTGVSDGLVRRAISEHYNIPEEGIRLSYASMTYFQIVRKLMDGHSLEGLYYGVPFFPQLAQRGGVIGLSGRYEFKYDGLRCIAHIYMSHDVKTVRLFSRKGKEITEQFPELVYELKAFPSCIVDGEIVAMGKDGRALPFQNVLQRARRKYAIEQYVNIVPIAYFLFDLVKTQTRVLVDILFSERHRILEEIYALHAPCERIHLAEGIEVNKDEQQRIIAFLNRSIELGHEGLMIKDLDSTYSIGKRTIDWLKLKQTLPTIDLVITGAQYGEGKKSGYFSSYEISALDFSSASPLKIVGWVGTGVQDHEMILLTNRLKPLVLSQDGKFVEIKPEVVLEILAEEVQISDKYNSGIALRFPRVVAIRDDKRVEEIASLEELKETSRGK